MDQRGIDAGLVHLLQHLLGGDLRDLAVLAGRRRDGLAPDMDLGVDDLHGRLPQFGVGATGSSSFSRFSSLHSSLGILTDMRSTFCLTSRTLSAPGMTAQSAG